MIQVEYAYLEQFRIFIQTFGIHIEEQQVVQFVSNNKVYINVVNQTIIGCQIVDKTGKVASYGEVE